ncbi:MAG: glycosyltransferase [Kiritimatiellae bacterium]|nr:glycosyltransferase [Kiritimatiellia bacterium]
MDTSVSRPHSYPAGWANLNVVFSHDWLTGMRGGERVLELLCDGFPNAPIYTLIYNPERISSRITRHPVVTSRLQRVPGIMRSYRYFLPFFPTAIRGMQPPLADLLISTSHCVAKGLRPRPGTRHLCYCFTPMRYAWAFHSEYFGNNPFKRAFISPILGSLRRWDARTSKHVTRFVAISQHVQRRIESCYARPADVVYPPVDTDFWTPAAAEPGNFDLIVSALVPYKRIDVAVRAYTRLGYPLKIVGTGTESDSLHTIAGPNVDFLGWQSDEVIRDLYRRCRCLVFPGEEDFGLVPIEAQACGRPVVAFARGGVLESVEEDITGVFFDDQDELSLLAAVEECTTRKWDPAVIRANAERFTIQNFIDDFAGAVSRCMADSV